MKAKSVLDNPRTSEKGKVTVQRSSSLVARYYSRFYRLCAPAREQPDLSTVMLYIGNCKRMTRMNREWA